MGDIFETFISTYEDSYQEKERTPPILEWEMCDITYCHIGLRFVP